MGRSLNVNGDVAQIFQWRPGAEVESNYPDFDFSDFYSELYDDYEFNETGKWIKRKVTSSFGMGSDSSKGKRTNNEYRVYIPR